MPSICWRTRRFFAPQFLAGQTEEVIRTFTGLNDLLTILPMRPGKLPFTFRDEVRQNILTIAPKVSSAQDTPLDTMSYVDNVFTAYEARFGHVISERAQNNEPINLSDRATKRIGKAIANRIFYEAFKTFRAFDNLSPSARFPSPATKWNMPGSDPLYDIERMRVYIGNLTGQGVDFLIMSRSINSALKIHPDVTAKDRNADAQFGPNGDLIKLMGMRIVTIPEVVFTLPNGNVLPMYPNVSTLDGTTYSNYVIAGVGGTDLGFSGAVDTAGAANSMAPNFVTDPDKFNRRFGVMGYVEMVHAILDYYLLTIMNGCL